MCLKFCRKCIYISSNKILTYEKLNWKNWCGFSSCRYLSCLFIAMCVGLSHSQFCYLGWTIYQSSRLPYYHSHLCFGLQNYLWSLFWCSWCVCFFDPCRYLLHDFCSCWFPISCNGMEMITYFNYSWLRDILAVFL